MVSRSGFGGLMRCAICNEWYGADAEHICIDDEPIEQNVRGGKGSKLAMDYTAVPQLGLREVARVMKGGLERYSRDNWLNVSLNTNINHAMAHLNKALLLIGDSKCDEYAISVEVLEELTHAACRCLMATEIYAREPGFIYSEDELGGQKAKSCTCKSKTKTS